MRINRISQYHKCNELWNNGFGLITNTSTMYEKKNRNKTKFYNPERACCYFCNFIFFFLLRSSWVTSETWGNHLYMLCCGTCIGLMHISRPDWIKMVSAKMFNQRWWLFWSKHEKREDKEGEEYCLALCYMHMFFIISKCNPKVARDFSTTQFIFSNVLMLAVCHHLRSSDSVSLSKSAFIMYLGVWKQIWNTLLRFSPLRPLLTRTYGSYLIQKKIIF